MELEIRPLTAEETLYAYDQSRQIAMMTGYVGYLRGDFGRSGTEFWTNWEDRPGDEKTDEFKAEFDDVINALRSDEQYGGLLKDRIAMGAYCRAHSEGGSQNELREFGFRVDTAQHSYIMRVNASANNYNFYIFCYHKVWLDFHIKQADQGIRFISPDFRERFRLRDGDKVRIITSVGESFDCVARYINDYHVEIGSTLYHICEFAEKMKRDGNTVIPLRSSLPELCYSVLAHTGTVVILRQGETSFYKTDIPAASREEAQALVGEYNRKLGLTKAQVEAMKSGSMFGWTCPAADPKNYDEQGRPIKPKQQSRGDAR